MTPQPIALVIEDNEDLNAIFTFALDKAGYAVKSVFNGTDALEFMAEIIPTIVILDLHMPGISGEVVLKHIRSDAKLKNIRVIVATADSAMASALQFETELVLLKPISFSQLNQLASRFMPKQTVAAEKM
jgi:two-component system cell cycle response regulator DivK